MKTVSDDAKAMTVSAPVAGEVIPLKDVNDEVFSNELVGKGMAIRPSDGTIYAPVVGTVEVTYASNHAFGFKSDSGIEVLIHIGLETVDMSGEGFKAFCEQEDRVKCNDKICEFDRDLIKSKGYDDTVTVVITNTDTFADVTSDKAGEITISEDLLKVE
ncbi:MAG: PTS glucose transporter subunit IIA [Aerococcus suis]|nr:PTS glucose transporter subunit IIA [Aerococcus suis]